MEEKKFEDDIPQSVKEERADELMQIQQEIAFERNEELVGKELKVLVDSLEGGTFIGRTEFDSPEVDNEVLIESPEEHLRIGDFVNVKVTGTEGFDLTAVPEGK